MNPIVIEELIEEISIYPKWVRVLILIGVSIAGWALLISLVVLLTRLFSS